MTDAANREGTIKPLTMTTSTPQHDDTQTLSRENIRSVAVAIGLLVCGLLLNIAVGIIAVIAFGPESVIGGGSGFLVAVIFGQLLVLVFALGYLRWRSLRVKVAAPSTSESVLILSSVLASVLAAFTLSALREYVFSFSVNGGFTAQISANPTLALVIGVLSVVLIAPAEELLFRGAIQGRLRERLGPRAAIVGASILFGAWHLVNFRGSLLSIVLAAGIIGIVSLLWGYTYERTGNFSVPVLTHGFYNLTLMGLAYAYL